MTVFHLAIKIYINKSLNLIQIRAHQWIYAIWQTLWILIIGSGIGLSPTQCQVVIYQPWNTKEYISVKFFFLEIQTFLFKEYAISKYHP